MDFSLVFLAFVLRTFVFDVFHVPAESMYPTLEAGDYVVVNKLGYGHYQFLGLGILETRLFATVEHGDIVAFEYPLNPEQSYMKRVIGMPGDTIKVVDGEYFVNGKLLRTEKKSVQDDFTYLKETNGNISYTIAHSPNDRKRLSFTVTVEPRNYFVMGDNRFNSNDSRYWGTVPEENLIGKLIYAHSKK